MPDWHDPTYLRRGNARQRRAYAVLHQLAVAQVLSPYDPVLTGTVPLDVDVPGSDLDIICEVAPADQPAFGHVVRACYGRWPGFRLRHYLVGGLPAVVVNFTCQGVPVELFGQGRPTRQQHAYRHLVVEHAVLAAGGAPWHAAVRALKRRGLKTEPAFATLLGLAGNPYDALLALAELPPAALAARVARCSPLAWAAGSLF